MTRFSALLDACVLVPIALTDTLLRLAEAGLYWPLWSTAILDEMVEAIEEIHPDLRPGRARHRADQMQGAFEDATVTGWEAAGHAGRDRREPTPGLDASRRQGSAQIED